MLFTVGVHPGGVQRVLAALQQGPQGGDHTQVLPHTHGPRHGGLLLHCQVDVKPGKSCLGQEYMSAKSS